MECRLPGVTVGIESREFRRELRMPPGETHIISFNLARRSSDIRACYIAERQTSAYRRLGDVTFLPAGVGLHAVGGDSGAPMLMCRFDPQRYADALGRLSEVDLERLAGCVDIRDHDIVRGLERLTEECRLPGLGSEVLIEGLAATLAVDLARWITASRPLSPTEGSLDELNAYLTSRLPEQPALAEVAEACGMSPRRLSAELGRATGRSFAQHLAELRIRCAQRLLETTDLALKEVCFKSGFRHVSSFTSAFRDATTETPHQYRRRRR